MTTTTTTTTTTIGAIDTPRSPLRVAMLVVVAVVVAAVPSSVALVAPSTPSSSTSSSSIRSSRRCHRTTTTTARRVVADGGDTEDATATAIATAAGRTTALMIDDVGVGGGGGGGGGGIGEFTDDDGGEEERGVDVDVDAEHRAAKATRPRPYPLFVVEKLASSLIDPFFFRMEDEEGGTTTTTMMEEDREKRRENIVVLGTGWGAASFLKNIDTNKYDVTVISPRNHFVFTPMLAGASVGTVDFKSITEPIREVRYVEASATSIDTTARAVSCVSVSCEGNTCETVEFDVNYDRLLFSVGARTTTFGIPGVEEYTNYLKQVGDAMQIKNAIVNCFESASLPKMTDADISRELTFVIIGAGPTGIEFAAELLDFIEEDGSRYYKDLLPRVRIRIVEASSTILRPFEDGLKNEALSRLTRTIEIPGVPKFRPLEVLLNKQVSEVSAKYIYFKDGDRLEYGMALWAAGIGPLPLTTSLIEELDGTMQRNAQTEFARGRLGVDPWLRVIGGGGRIFSLGDCSCMSNTPFLPATAQVASQQGEYLGRLLSNEYSIDVATKSSSSTSLLPPMVIDRDQPRSFSERIASFTMGDDEVAAPFQFLDLGILAYTGSGSALAQVQVAPGRGDPTSETWNPVRLQIKGKLGFGLWRSIYLWKQTSPKNVVLVTLDWIKVKLFGRDISIL
ncbi:hypothetical protein ACHAXA_010421 [Cyclostephanos tholiformis]|uniref:NADH:ubiquinone reductase (non-electrogenic) n=1 Tax=Cyclostephanos tholiformis TaxID=382380 RepID=A0ABD3SFL0_9STRA